MVQDNFTRFGPGERAQRPTTATGWRNLFLAGDHVRMEAPVFLMEAAAVSGRLAANGILVRDGVRQIPVWTVSPRGPLA